VVPPEPVAKPPASNGPIAFACDNSQTVLQCQTFAPGSAMAPKTVQEQKVVCPSMALSAATSKAADHCPSAGLTGRCEDPATGITTYYYYPASTTELMWSGCDKKGGRWSAP
jgi:hypothetical protein